jgi:hypothetical protein
MKVVKAFKTEDGTLFEDSSEAERHSVFLSKRSEIEEFLECDLNPYKAAAHRGIAKNTIVNWNLWKTKNER